MMMKTTALVLILLAALPAAATSAPSKAQPAATKALTTPATAANPGTAAPLPPADAAAEGQTDLSVPPPPSVAGKAYELLDHHSGQVLAGINNEQRLEPASLTKIMTVYVIAHELKQGNVHYDDKVVVSEKAWHMDGSRTFIEVGKTIGLKDLLMGVVIQSGNDASVALAEHVSGSEEVFTSLMNQHAARLGMKQSHFVNVSGLPDANHYTTAHDLALLASAMIRDFPEVYAMFKVKEFTFNGIKQHNRNKLLWRDETVDGMKTGHTDTAGYCLVASAERQGMRLISVLLGAVSDKQRATDTSALLNFGFRFYESHKLYSANQSLGQARVWHGAVSGIDVGVLSDFYVTVPRNQYKSLAAALALKTDLMAPLSRGQAGGTIKFNLAGKDWLERPLYVLKPVVEGGFVRRWIDDAWLWIKS
jgi:serine-type D-Ala-D-Ala carboxypeptidase (penicillin-binding protein 5/6)